MVITDVYYYRIDNVTKKRWLFNHIYKKGGEKMDKLIRFFKEEEGATAVEYGVMVAAIIAAVVVIVFALGNKISSAFQNVNSQLQAHIT